MKLRATINRLGLQHHILAILIVAIGTLAACGALDGCKSGSPDIATIASVANVAVRIADDTCREIATADASPDWVTLACDVIEAVPRGKTEGTTQKVIVTMPRATWAARKPCPPPCPSLLGGDGGIAWDASQGKGGGK